MERSREQRNQMALIGAALLNAKKCRDSILQLYPDEFEEGILRESFRAIRRMVCTNKPVDIITVGDFVTKETGAASGDVNRLLLEASETSPAVNHAAEYAALIVEDYRTRELRSCMESLIMEGGSSDSVCAQLRAQLARQDRISNAQGDDTAKEFGEAIDETFAALAAPDTSLKLDWPEIDRFGFFERTNVVVLSARPGGGKTDLAINLAARFARHYRVYYLTMEESRRKLVARMLSRCSQIDAGRIRDKQLKEQELKTLRCTADLLRGHTNMVLDADPGITVEQIRGKILRYKPDVAFVDHIGLIQGRPGQKEYEKLAEITRELKNIAMDMGIVVIELSQMNRQVDRTGGAKKAQMSDLRGSGTIEQDANVVLMIDTPPADDDEPLLAGTKAYKDASIRVKKNREGARGKIPFRWQPQYHSWEPVPDAAHDYYEDAPAEQEPIPDKAIPFQTEF